MNRGSNPPPGDGNAGIRRLHGQDAIRHALTDLLEGCTAGLFLVLPSPLPAFPEALLCQALIRIGRRRQGEARILTGDAAPIARQLPRLVETCRRLPSRVHLRQRAEDAPGDPRLLLITDHCGVLHLPIANTLEGWCDEHAAGTARRLERELAEAWRGSVPSPEYRSLRL